MNEVFAVKGLEDADAWWVERGPKRYYVPGRSYAPMRSEDGPIPSYVWVELQPVPRLEGWMFEADFRISLDIGGTPDEPPSLVSVNQLPLVVERNGDHLEIIPQVPLVETKSYAHIASWSEEE